MSDLKWSFFQVWNQSLEQGKAPRELKVRNNMWATEIGGAYVDRYLKMKAVTPTNPPNPRSMRKFEAGNMMEWLVGLVLKRAGILQENQTWLSYQYPGLLEVTGKLDFFAGGQPNWLEANTAIQSLELPEFFNRATQAIIDHFSTAYPNGLEEVILEVKSCSAYMFEYYEKFGASPSHILQVFHYLKAKNMSEAHIVYISKDDLRMLEFGVFNPSPVEEVYRTDIERMTKILQSGKQPEKEPLVEFDAIAGKFRTNWKVMYSNYLTMLYGFKDQMAYEEEYRAKVGKWNRVLARVVNNANMTPANLTIIDEIRNNFSNYEELVKIAREKGIKEEEAVE